MKLAILALAIDTSECGEAVGCAIADIEAGAMVPVRRGADAE
jgi:hypothetical protein